MHIFAPSMMGVSVSYRALALALALGASGTGTAAWAADADADADAEIVVTGHREERLIEAGPLGARSILETPFSVAQADSEQIKRIAATTIDAAFNYDPSIRSNNSGVASGNTFSVRGQSVDLTNGYKYDGLAFPYWFQDHPIEAVDQIQVLKGAGGFVYGYASPSGVVNFVSKKPTRELNAVFDVSYRSSSIWRTHLDIGGPLTDNPDGIAFRFNAVHEEGKLYNGADNKNTFAQLWLQGNITPGLTWSLDGYYQRTWQAQQSNGIGLNAAVTSLAPVSGKLNLGSASTTKFNDIAQVTGRLNYQIAKDWKASLALRYSTLDERFPGNTATILDNSGRFQINVLNQNRVFFYYVGQASIEGKFRTGAIEHTLVGGLDYLNVDFDYDFQPFTANGKPTTAVVTDAIGNIYSGVTPDWAGRSVTIANPASGGPSVTIGTRDVMRPPNWFRYQEIRQRGLFLSDTAKWGPVELMAGLRYTWYDEFNNEPVITKTRYQENSLTPVAALSYDLAEGARVYVSYVEALQRGAQAPTTAANPGDSFGPIKSTQYEAGIKVQRANWGATLAVYKTSVPSEYVNTANVFVRDGERRFQGIEFDANWRVTKELYLKYAAAYLDAIQTAAQNSAVVGKVVPGTTDFQTSGFVEYTPSVFPGLSVFGGVRYSGKAYGQVTNTFVFDPVTVGDLGVSYTLPAAGKQFKISANVQNITDKWYWIPSSAGTGLSAGAPRTFTVSLNVATGPIAQGGPIRSGDGVLRDTGWYLGLAAGGTQAAAGNFDIKSRTNAALGPVTDDLRTAFKPGWELAGSLGYDFGKFRGEFELSHQQFELKRATLNSSAIPIERTNRPAGTYEDANGTTRILALMANGLFDIGGNARTRWAFEAGGGIGIARLHQHRWQLQEAAPDTVFANENKLDFAWQALVGTRYRLTDRLEATLRYRYFTVPNAYLQTTTANALEGSFRTHSLLAGVNFRL